MIALAAASAAHPQFFPGVPKSFWPWASDLSPSALYQCSLGKRKAAGIKTPEVKWVSVKRWVTTTPSGVDLPPGVFLSVKRKEWFVSSPKPHLEKVDFTLLMFPYGNVWSQTQPDVPITEEWMWTTKGGRTFFEMLMERDANEPVKGYFASCLEFMRKHPDQIGIHLKRKRSVSEP